MVCHVFMQSQKNSGHGDHHNRENCCVDQNWHKIDLSEKYFVIKFGIFVSVELRILEIVSISFFFTVQYF